MKINNPIEMKRQARRLQEAAASDKLENEIRYLELLLSDLDTALGDSGLESRELESSFRKAREEFDGLITQYARQRSSLIDLSFTLTSLLENLENAQTMSCIDDSLTVERESSIYSGRSQLLVSNSKTAKENKKKALKAHLESKGKS